MHELRENDPQREATRLSFQFVAMTETAAHAIAAWTYPPPYTLYNHEPEQRPAVVRSLLDSDKRFSPITDGDGDLVAFCCLGTDAQVRGGGYERPATDIGMGMRPNLTGLGHGPGLIEAILDYAMSTHPDSTMRVTIAGFNARAQRVWEKARFQEERCFVRASDGMAFRVMTRPPAGPYGEADSR